MLCDKMSRLYGAITMCDFNLYFNGAELFSMQGPVNNDAVIIIVSM